MWHEYCPNKRVKIYKKDNLSYFKIAKIDDREEDTTDVGKVVFKAAIMKANKQNNKLQNQVTFGGPDVHKLQKTAEIAGFVNSGSLPESRIKEIEAAKMKAIYRSKRPTEKTDKPMYTFV